MSEVLKFLTYILTNHGFWAVMSIIAISIVPLLATVYIIFSGSGIGKLINEEFSKKAEEQKDIHKTGNRLRKQFSQNANLILDELVETTGANRALVFEFSNGTTNLVGLPFLFMSVTAEVTKPGMNLISQMHQKINTSIFSEFLNKLEDQGCIFIEDYKNLSQEYKILSFFMLPRTTKSLVFYPIQGVDEVIGFIVITLPESEEPVDRHEIIPLISKATQKMGALLNFSELTDEMEEINKKNKKWKWPWKA